ncbi:MAG: Flp pilus assembly complex ATPase component TadA [Silvanigrellaceae bacterium]|nr:Flp pilus assembly complex ATPase component TadA [Silvanigrellaceae bacterium]
MEEIEQKEDVVKHILDKINFSEKVLFETPHHILLNNSKEKKRLGELLVEKKKVTQQQLEAALEEQATTKEKIGEILVEKEVLSELDLIQAIAEQLFLPFYTSLPMNDIDTTLIKDLSIRFCLQHSFIPVSSDRFSVTLAVSDPLKTSGLDDIRVLFGKKINRIVCPKEVVEATINAVFEHQDLSEQVKALGDGDEDGGIEGLDDIHDLLHDTEDAPVRKEVSTIIRRGIAEKASDIHIEPFEDRVSVRMRMDGRMREVRVIPKKFQSSVTTRIKILAKLNIAESRLPQDGRISLRVGSRDIDVRVSVLPIKYGERIVLRILDKSGGLPELYKIGMPQQLFKNFEQIIQQKHGIVLVTGPTGSGKTTTLASALMYINKPDISIITVEDPVEIQLPGVSQVEVNDKAGLTFAAALRSILRQNPNVILIGEIRDAETANIAVQASITGHLVFSTLHTNDTAATVTRLVDFGIEPFQITTAVVGILAVRLVRKVCQGCKEPANHTFEELEMIGLTKEQFTGKTFYKARQNGCNVCKQTGYQGRVGIYELMVFDDAIRGFVLKSADGASLRRMCIQRGMKTLRDSVLERLQNGETTLEEALYATQMESSEAK